MAVTAVDPAEARAALATVAGRLTALLRSVERPQAHAVGEWNVGETAIHLGNAWDILPGLARRQVEPLIDDVWQLGGVTTSLTRAATERDIPAIADRIDAAAASFLETAAAADQAAPTPWLVRGVEMTMPNFVCHLLNESLVHGFDIARAEGKPWPVEPAHARLILEGFLFPVLSSLPPTALVVQERARGLSARYELRLRQGPRVEMAFADGAVAIGPPSGERVDCRISANPGALLLVMWGRIGQWQAARRGQMVSWGRRPWLGPRLRHLLRNP